MVRTALSAVGVRAAV